MANAQINWAFTGIRIAEVIPLKLDETGKKYVADAQTYIFDTLSDGSGYNGPPPNKGKSEKTYKSLETTSAQTLRVEVKPETHTLYSTSEGTNVKTETGTSGEPVTPKLELFVGNTPKIGSERGGIKEFLQARIKWQETPVLIRTDMGKDTAGNNIGTFAGVFTLGEVLYAPKGKTQEPDKLSFSVETVTLGIETLNAGSHLPFGYKSGSEVPLAQLTAEHFQTIATGGVAII